MNAWELMRARHAVRSYVNHPIEAEKVAALQQAIEDVNREAGLHIQLFTEEPEAFNANAAHYGQFSGCRNYLAMVGPKDADEAIGYYGEKLVLLAQELGLNTCWVALTFRKNAVTVDIAPEEKLHVVIALGYGETQGVQHKSKAASAVSNLSDSSPQWFRDGVEAALLAPTAINQQKFSFTQNGRRVKARTKLTFYGRMDLGIAKYHFELGAGKENFDWA
ncbi:MAG: nitroreductase [Oscillospiraceae bacterium]|nr:nitroreductase [Oscillospiraceae bacterium]